MAATCPNRQQYQVEGSDAVPGMQKKPPRPPFQQVPKEEATGRWSSIAWTLALGYTGYASIKQIHTWIGTVSSMLETVAQGCQPALAITHDPPLKGLIALKKRGLLPGN